MRLRSEAGPSAWRGQAVEAGLDCWLMGGVNIAPHDFPSALTVAEHRYHEQAMGEISPKIDLELAALPGYLLQATEALKDHPPILTKQTRISIDLPGIEVPVVGYIDYMLADYGIDLKTTVRMPSEPRQDHVDQMAIYMEAKKQPFRLLYVTAKKNQMYEVTPAMAARSMAQLVNGAKSIRHLLLHSHDAADALNFFFPDYSSFYWSPETIAAVRRAHHYDGDVP